MPNNIIGTLSKGQVIIFVDIVGFTTICADLDAADVGVWVESFYDAVSDAAIDHCLRVVDHRGDCCVCMTGEQDGVCPVTRTLAFTRDLCVKIASLKFIAIRTRFDLNVYYKARMGVAMGEVELLRGGRVDDNAAFLSILGSVVDMAERMEVLYA
jgi:class 3 adenylate cyclase